MADRSETTTPDDAARHASVLLCTCAHYDIIPAASKKSLSDFLSHAGIDVEIVPDLCGLAADRDPLLHHWARGESPVVIACFPRAVRWLFYAAGVPLNGKPVQFFNMRTQSAEEITAALSRASTSGGNHQSSIINPQSSWVPWFPVIDYDRCRNCKQCLNFCLFGVYVLSPQGQVQVQKPTGCKTNCPACARMCPAKAIIFPKYAESPINGAETDSVSPAERKAAEELRAFVKSDVYDKIRRRSPGTPRFSTESKEGGGHG